MTVKTSYDLASKTLNMYISGRFDFSIHQDIRKATDQVDNNLKAINVDLSAVDYIDSSALGMLLVLRDKVGENKEAVHIRGAKSDVKKILEIANFGQLFTIN